MEDSSIVDLYLARDERAIRETDGKYGKNVQNKKTGFPYQALYSYKLIFRFTTEAGMLSYLDGREFTAQDVWFLNEFRAFPK